MFFGLHLHGISNEMELVQVRSTKNTFLNVFIYL
jgi:hypothetical protein